MGSGNVSNLTKRSVGEVLCKKNSLRKLFGVISLGKKAGFHMEFSNFCESLFLNKKIFFGLTNFANPTKIFTGDLHCIQNCNNKWL